MRVRKNWREPGSFAISLLIHLCGWAYLAFDMSFLSIELPSQSVPIEIEVVLAPPPPQVKKHAQQIVQQAPPPIEQRVPQNAQLLGEANHQAEKETIAKEVGKFQNSENKNELKAYEKGDLVTAASTQSQTDDALDEVAKSLKTTLTTKKHAYFAYYKQLRDQVKIYWEPLVDEKIKPVIAERGSAWAIGDRLTKLVLIIGYNGNLLDVAVVKSSGLAVADNAALEAMRSASPFAPPPEEILNAEGNVQMTWDLIVESSN